MGEILHDSALTSDVNDTLWDEADKAGRISKAGEREDGAILWTLAEPPAVAPELDQFGYPVPSPEQQLAQETKHARQYALQLAIGHAQAVFAEYDVENGTKTSFVITYARAFEKFLLQG